MAADRGRGTAADFGEARQRRWTYADEVRTLVASTSLSIDASAPQVGRLTVKDIFHRSDLHSIELELRSVHHFAAGAIVARFLFVNYPGIAGAGPCRCSGGPCRPSSLRSVMWARGVEHDRYICGIRPSAELVSSCNQLKTGASTTATESRESCDVH